MGWFSKKPKAEPVYSELGSELYRLLEEKSEEWRMRTLWDYGYNGVLHLPSMIEVQIHSTGVPLRIQVGPNRGEHYVHHLLTEDDRQRIRSRVELMLADYQDQQDKETVHKALQLIKPNPFDATARELARCVLRGDTSAGRPLVDKAIEQLSNGGGW